MKKQFAIFVFGCTACGTVLAAGIDWWNHDTICQINDTRCYTGTTAGVDFSFETGWDISGNCRGKKYICANALNPIGTGAVAMERADILRGVGISSDFDTNVYVTGEDCYGARKTKQNGTMASVNGEYVPVWCNGVLSDPADEALANGEIPTTTTPTCEDLAARNYVATLNGNCYGKQYDANKYAIDCTDGTPTIIVLNGAQYNPAVSGVTTQAMAETRFTAMYTSATTQRAIHFPKQLNNFTITTKNGRKRARTKRNPLRLIRILGISGTRLLLVHSP